MGPYKIYNVQEGSSVYKAFEYYEMDGSSILSKDLPKDLPNKELVLAGEEDYGFYIKTPSILKLTPALKLNSYYSKCHQITDLPENLIIGEMSLGHYQINSDYVMDSSIIHITELEFLDVFCFIKDFEMPSYYVSSDDLFVFLSEKNDTCSIINQNYNQYNVDSYSPFNLVKKAGKATINFNTDLLHPFANDFV